MHDETKCDCRVKLALKLCEAFPALNWSLGDQDDSLSIEETANWLECTDEETQTLVDVGLLLAADDRIKLADMVAFIEQTDWLRRRAEKHLLELQTQVIRDKERREWRSANAAAEAREVAAPEAV